MNSKESRFRFGLPHLFLVLASCAFLFGALKLGVLGLLLAPFLVPTFVLGTGTLFAIKAEQNRREKIFLIVQALTMLLFLAMLIGIFQALLARP
jgi:hypothetical protein